MKSDTITPLRREVYTNLAGYDELFVNIQLDKIDDECIYSVIELSREAPLGLLYLQLPFALTNAHIGVLYKKLEIYDKPTLDDALVAIKQFILNICACNCNYDDEEVYCDIAVADHLDKAVYAALERNWIVAAAPKKELHSSFFLLGRSLANRILHYLSPVVPVRLNSNLCGLWFHNSIKHSSSRYEWNIH